MSLHKDGPQLVDLSDPLFVSTMNASEFADISKFDPVRSRNEMSLCSINKTDHPNNFPISNHKTMATRRVRIGNVENTRRDTEDPKMTKNTNTRERKDTPVNHLRKIAYWKKNTVSTTVNDDTTTCKQRLPLENPPTNAEIEPPGVVGCMVPDIKPVK